VTDTSGTAPDLRAAAAELHAAGLCVLPIKADGTKAPAVSWMQYKVERSTPDQHDAWFTGDRPRGIAVVYGAVSGAVELIEFEGLAIREGLLDEVTEVMQGSGLGEVWAAIQNGWVTESPSGGRHYRVRLDGAAVPRTASWPAAWRPRTSTPPRNGSASPKSPAARSCAS
jgi:hypothetical protein